ncbi:cystathionine beta-lyase [bacterium]|nr:cystathionine beta-lyase [bacterium]
MTDKKPRALDTRLTHTGRGSVGGGRGVNPPLLRASTLLVERARDLYDPRIRSYAIHGSAMHDALAEAWCEVETADHCVLVGSGLLACTLPIFAFAETGAHILICDNVYGPTRRFCERTLSRYGCTFEFFDPALGGGVADLIREETRLVFLENPGSLSMEICDAPAIAEAARARGVLTAMDNTWGAGVFHKPLDFGIDLSIQAGTKYPSGSADVLIGGVFTRSDRLAARLRETVADLGLNTSPDDAFLVLRGLRSMPTRLRRHEASGLEIADWLSGLAEVSRVLHPALPDAPGHALWRRDFTGSAGLFSIVLNAPADENAACAFLDALELFGLGFSWGGFESLAIHCDPQLRRSAARETIEGPLLRFSIGLEDPADLKADLERGFAALRAANGQSAV